MLKKDILLIINPNASKGRTRKKAKRIAEYFSRNGRQCTVAYTCGKGHAESLARRGSVYEYKVIVAAGGDGTVNEVANGIMRSGRAENVKMGIIPLGRGNDFAWLEGITRNMYRADEKIIKDEARPCDVGICSSPEKPEGMYFLNGTGFGLEPMVNFKASEYRHLNGMPSYVAAFLHILFNPPEPDSLTLSIDGEERKLETQQISVCNGRRMGSAFIMAPKAEIDDGELDIMNTNHPVSGSVLLKAAIRFLTGGVLKDRKLFSYQRGKRIEIEGECGNIQAHSDGEEYTRSGRKFLLEILPSALNLIR